jgi:hypothetical protein
LPIPVTFSKSQSPVTIEVTNSSHNSSFNSSSSSKFQAEQSCGENLAMDMAAATAAVHPRASSLSHSSSCFRITTLPALGSRPAASPCSRSSSSSSFCSCWDGVGQQQLRVQMVGKKSGREQVGGGGGGGIVSTFAFDAEKPILYENGEEPPTVVSAPNRRIVAIGDLHGDLGRTLWALQLAGVLSNDGLHRWTGGTTVTNTPNLLPRDAPIATKQSCIGREREIQRQH